VRKIGRNDLCWCGSGKKYKDCHLNRVQQQAVTLQEALDVWKKNYGRRYCLYPECKNEDIVKAHTVQRRGGLDRIARNGHVYGFIPDLTKPGVITGPRLIGVKRASTFTGFCKLHDSKVFEPIEKHPFEVNQHHIFLLSYRAICRAVFMKKVQLELMPFKRQLDRGKKLDAQIHWQKGLSVFEMGLKKGWNDIYQAKLSYDVALLHSDFSEMRYCVITLANVPSFLCCEALQPEYDFAGNLLQDFADTDSFLDVATFSIITTTTGGAIVFGWMGGENAGKRLADSLLDLPEQLIPHTIVRFTFEYCENIYMSPDWWDKLDAIAKASLVRRVKAIVSSSKALKDDSLRIVDWRIVGNETNLG